MKKLISTFVCVMGFVAMSFAQDATNTAVTNGTDALAKSKASGAYVYTLPETATNEMVEKASSYYVSHFTVDFDDAINEAKITLLTEEASSRFIMVRFLSGCGVRYLEVDGQALELQEFMDKHLQ